MIRLQTVIKAPMERCFDLARSIDLHVASQSRHGEKAIAGVVTGLIGLGEEVTWRARHFGIRQTFTSQIAEFNRPAHFRDVMVRGAFHRFEHDHDFERMPDGTMMVDLCRFEAPFGLLGALTTHLVLRRHLIGLLRERASVIRHAAESGEWRRYLDGRV
jgi:ligand-binding SRPBCC domain-containing protein